MLKKQGIYLLMLLSMFNCRCLFSRCSPSFSCFFHFKIYELSWQLFAVLWVQALIHFESKQSQSKQIDYLDSLVVKFIEPNSEISNAASLGEREELSSIFLEVVFSYLLHGWRTMIFFYRRQSYFYQAFIHPILTRHLNLNFTGIIVSLIRVTFFFLFVCILIMLVWLGSSREVFFWITMTMAFTFWWITNVGEMGYSFCSNCTEVLNSQHIINYLTV